jgi:muramoyltetrapeptide carboxypeptidase LdcA involved in peptidoglycan recycling
MEAFEDINIKGIICAIGGDDTIRLLPYINIDVIKKNPKIFMGYSDSTSNHLMMYKAGLVSFYGPSVMCEFGEYVSMFDYTVQAVRKFLFEDTTGYKIESSPVWSKDYIPWSEENMHTAKVLEKEDNGYEVLQGDGIVTGHLLGGCVDTFIMSNGTSIWPTIEEWTGAIMFIETSEDHPSPEILKWIFRNLAAQGILKVIHGILVGKPEGGIYYNEYKNVLLQVVKEEEHLSKLPVIYNVNFGHAVPIGILPYGIRTKLDCDNKEIILMESATEE